MPHRLSLERVAIHLVDREDAAGPRYSEDEVHWESYQQAERETIEEFLARHVRKAVDAVEGSQTRSAEFNAGSEAKRMYDRIRKDPGTFFGHSRDVARLLYDASPRSASPGLLLVLWFTVENDERPFLGLFKLDPGQRDQVVLERDKGQILLRLAVEHIELALPNPEDQVLKWALIPHPAQAPVTDLKIRDEQQTGADPAIYFSSFLGCRPRPTAKQQVRNLFKAIEDYGSAFHSGQKWEARVGQLVTKLAGQPSVTSEVVIESVKAAKVFSGFQEDAFKERLRAAQEGTLRVDPQALEGMKIRYDFPSGIILQGPAAAVTQLVEIRKVAGGWEFCVRTPEYPEKRFE